MAGTVTKVRVAPAWVTYGGTNLGYTKGGSNLVRKVVTQPIIIQGVPLDDVVIYKETTVSVNLAETSYNNLKTLLHLVHSRGVDLFDYTATLTLTATDDPADITTVAGAYCTGNTSVPFMFNQERVWPVQFRAIYTATDFSFAEIT